MRIEKGSYCIVASTLPVGFMVAQFEALHIRKIFVMSKELEDSYLSFKRHKDMSIDVIRVPEGLLAQVSFFLHMLIGARLAGISVVFFHECCLPVLDVLLNIVRPSGYYLPQVSMSSWQEIEFSQFPYGRMAKLLRWLGIAGHFRYYHSAPVGDAEGEYVLSAKKYPESIVTMSIAFSRDAVSKSRFACAQTIRKILFITGKSSVADESQRKLYLELVRMAQARGYECHVKDHPNPVYRLDMKADGVVIINPELPAELLEPDYYLVVGVSSSALLNFDGYSVSLLRLIEGMSEKDREARMKHFSAASPDNKIQYVQSTDQFASLL